MAESKILATNIKNTTRRPLPAVCFLEIKNKVLGQTYNLSLVLIGDYKAQKLNQAWRHKNTKANILSFPLDQQNGEIYLNLAKCEREHKKFKMTYTTYVAYLFIHGLLHLKGYAHSSTMEIKERQILSSFNFHDQKHRRRT